MYVENKFVKTGNVYDWKKNFKIYDIRYDLSYYIQMS